MSSGGSSMVFQSQDSNTGGSNHSADGLEPSPEKPVTNPRTPTERKRKRPAKNSQQAQQTQQQQAQQPTPGSGLMAGGPIPDIMGSAEAHKTNKPINEYFPKRAPSSPVRGGTKSPLSFGSMFPQSPSTKTAYVSSPSGNAANNGPPVSYNMGDHFGLGRPAAATNCKNLQTDLTMAEITKRTQELDSRETRIDELQRMNDELTRHLTTRNKEVESSKNTITKCLAVVKELLIEKSRIERKDARAKCMQNRLRLGQFVTQRVGATFQENWTDGYAFQVRFCNFAICAFVDSDF